MGLLDKFKKNNKNEGNEIIAPGWDAITELCNKIYPDQINPKHYAASVSWELGGNDPLQGISVYDGGDYWHFVTYGLSELYEKESDIKDISGYGMDVPYSGSVFKINSAREISPTFQPEPHDPYNRLLQNSSV